MNGAEISEIIGDSLAAEIGLAPGDRITGINGKPVSDLIQLQYEWAGEEILLEIQKKNGQREVFEIEKEYDEPIGAVFKQAVFDKIRVCRNKCLFCFVDQLPAGLRESLYLKDEDYRLSFLQGSYITLTNLSREDLVRIKNEHLSPLYLSVHTTDPVLRSVMLQNPQAGYLMEVMQELAQSGIEFHTQVVLCPGVNDGASLDRTFRDLCGLDAVLSLAVVPVGLTSHRSNLPDLRVFSHEEACDLIRWVEEKQKVAREKRGSNFVWLADEFYLKAQADFPPCEDYEDFAQLENGVGMVRLLISEFAQQRLPGQIHPPREVVMATGVSAAHVLQPIINRLNLIRGFHVNLLALQNEFFGPTITVAGLLTGSDLLRGLSNVPADSQVYIPDIMLKTGGGQFLDGLTVAEVAGRLNLEIFPVPADVRGIMEMLKERK